ncbi:MAG: TIGR03936 family radical SAM-associated protein [Eubacteriaceae bacterium]|nr:TIGR03936 family radical SAM-associated protein [Eubacteriaceae bacterium]
MANNVAASEKYRMCYKKTGDMAYISQLDLQRLFQRAFRRAGIRLAHTHGFNPHPKLAFSMPVPIFVESEAEYLDFSIEGSHDDATMQQLLQPCLPEGIFVVGITKLLPNSLSLSKLISNARYEAYFSGAGIDPALADAEYESASLIYTKEGKKGKPDKQIDLKASARFVDFNVSNGDLVTTFVLPMSSASYINPSAFTQALQENLSCLGAVELGGIRKVSVMSSLD